MSAAWRVRCAVLLAAFAVFGCRAGGGAALRGYACPGCNLLLVSVDTLRADHLSCYGYARDTSPELCAFFEEGARFERAISQSSWTSPAHASMFTGLLPAHHGVANGPDTPVLEGRITLFARLREAGYFVVALHGGGYLDPVVQGETFDFEGFGGLRNDLVAWLEQALARKPAEQPFFVFLHGYDVHSPYRTARNHFPPAEPAPGATAAEARGCRWSKLPDGSQRIDPASVPRDPETRAFLEAAYDGAILEVDHALGRLFDHLQASGLAAETVVLLTSDHGEEFWEHGSCQHVQTVYNELVHVPLLLRAPGGEAWVEAAPVAASISIFPTVLQLLGLAAEPGLDGRSLFEPPPRQVLAEARFFVDSKPLRRYAAVGEGLKLVWDAGAGREELYDLTADWRELRDLGEGAEAPRRARLRRALDAYLEAAPPEAPPATLSPDTRERLRELGYGD